MKYYQILFLLVALSSCKPKTADTAEQHLREENFALKTENDSLNAIIERSERKHEGDTIQKLPEVPPQTSYPAFPGKHNLTLQWISWDKPGSAIIRASDNGWYTINGSQMGDKGNYLKIDGRIRPLSNRELEFDGKIETRVDFLNQGEPCVRTGTKVFKATGTRKYWRLQDMINCEGGTVTDYVDIYF